MNIGHKEFSAEGPSGTTRRPSRAPAASMRTRVGRALEGQEPTLSDVALRDSKTHSPRLYRAGPSCGGLLRALGHEKLPWRVIL